jgi:hypothetical protein
MRWAFCCVFWGVASISLITVVDEKETEGLPERGVPRAIIGLRCLKSGAGFARVGLCS